MFGERLHRVRRQRRRLDLILLRELIEEEPQQHRNVFTTIAQRRHADVNDVQPVVEILAERLVGDAVDQNAVGRGDDANVDPVLNLIRADALDFTSLEKPE